MLLVRVEMILEDKRPKNVEDNCPKMSLLKIFLSSNLWREIKRYKRRKKNEISAKIIFSEITLAKVFETR